MEVRQNIISEKEQNYIERNLTDYRFPWHFIQSSDLGIKADLSYLESKQEEFKNKFIIDPPQFYHSILTEGKPGPFFEWFTPILDQIYYPGMKILRMKVNLTIPYVGSSEKSLGVPHVDLPDESDYKTIIYYVTKSDGNTIIFNENKGHKGLLTIKHISTPEKGKVLIFNGNTLHAACPPASNQTRIVLNINVA